MPQISTYKNLVVIVDQELVGDKRRKQNLSGFHPMVRDDEQWVTSDNIRGLLSRYRTVYRGSKGFALINYGAMVAQLRNGVLLGAYESGPGGIGRLRKQLQGPNEGTNIVFNYTITPLTDTGASLKLSHDSRSLSAWDSYGNKAAAAQSLLSPGDVDIFKDYMLDGLELSAGTFDSILSGNLGVSFLDHTTIIYLTDSDKEIRDPTGLDLQIEPTYNFYASTTPPYELASGGQTASKIKEYHLPNVYFLEAELRNTGSSLLATYHLPALTLNETVNWFETYIGIAQTVTSEVEDRFYDVYAEGLQSLANATNEAFDLVDTNLQRNNRNFAILHRDLSALDDERVTEDTLPFYNRVILGNDINQVTGKRPEIGILRYLSNNEDTRDFIDILQMETIIKLSSGTQNLPTREFTTMVKKFNSSPLVNPNDWNYSVGDQEYTLLYDLKDMIEDYEDDNRDIIVANLINTFSSMNPDVLNIGIDANSLNFRLIRDYQIPEEESFVDYQHVSNAYVDMFEADDSPSHFSRVHRNLEEVYKNDYCHTETLLYVVKKKLTPNGAPVQTYYISPPFSTGASAKSFFYDTQVKYGRQYYYEFEKVVVIFGNQYRYSSTPVFGTSGAPGNFNEVAMKVSNLPSIKVALVPYVIPQSGIETIILDKPPVPPEVSFYAHKGIDNKLKILLNSSTGEFQAKPVIINETDIDYFINEYRSQTGDFSTPDDDVVNKKITFRSDDPVDRYQLFKLDSKPQSYADFAGTQTIIDPELAIPGSFLDTIEPNRKYYYCARSVDVHGNVSNPGHIYEIEIINNNGQIFMRQQVVRYETSKPDYSKQGRRFLYIEPSLQQVAFPPENELLITEVPNPQNSPDSNILGVSDIDKVWDKAFKIRLTSKKTGRKIDLNLTFKNTGITNTSE